MKILEATEEGVVFPAKVGRDGVIVGDGKAEDLAHEIAGEMGRTVAYVEGDFETTTFVFGRPLTEKEIELLEILWA